MSFFLLLNFPDVMQEKANFRSHAAVQNNEGTKQQPLICFRTYRLLQHLKIVLKKGVLI